jgi:hypothetical protein
MYMDIYDNFLLDNVSLCRQIMVKQKEIMMEQHKIYLSSKNLQLIKSNLTYNFIVCLYIEFDLEDLTEMFCFKIN